MKFQKVVGFRTSDKGKKYPIFEGMTPQESGKLFFDNLEDIKMEKEDPPDYSESFSFSKYKKLTREEIQDMQEGSNAVFFNAPQEERVSLFKYTVSLGGKLNKYLSNQIPKFKEAEEAINAIDSLISKYKLTEDIITYKGTSEEYYEDAKIGERITIPVYLSTSLSEETANHFSDKNKDPVVLEIRVPKGSNCLYIGDNTGYDFESELLLGRNTKFKVVDKQFRKIILEVCK